MKNYTYTKYQTDSHYPEYIHYWDKNFSKLPMWWDWLLIREFADDKISVLMDDTSFNDAINTVYQEFINGTQGFESDFRQLWTNARESFAADDIPKIFIHLHVGTQMHSGLSETQARENYIKWLGKGKNRYMGKYVITDDLTVTTRGSSKGKRTRK